ncbi:hypothetical protein QYE76_030898 [Lolium multiflorum]|uniref:Uncharacterized protein n=1 Tax=Lolium multiflorum TaxID=4521 RepID=A0AAD8QRP6_LOLMU|nr:hypothetical protein QYE76_030898 [Lolium multiflorum]
MKLPNRSDFVSFLIFCTCMGLLIGFVVYMAESDKEYYTVEITGVKWASFPDASATATSTPSFNVTMRIDNRYHHDLYITDWGFSLWLDGGVPLGRGSFPYDLIADSMSETTVTGTTSTALVGIGTDSHISTGSKSMEDLELQVDIRFTIVDLDHSIGGYNWLWCSARVSEHSAPSLCRPLGGAWNL